MCDMHHPVGKLIATVTIDLYRDDRGRVTYIPDITVRGDDPQSEDVNLRAALVALADQLCPPRTRTEGQ